MLAVIRISCSPKSIGFVNSACTRSPNATASSVFLIWLAKIANSSPPKRLAVAPGSIDFFKRRATSISSLSPIKCPSVSLTLLNLSRSIKRTANLKLASSFARWTTCSSRLTNKARFGKLVKASCVESCCNFCSNSLRVVISVWDPTMR